MTALDLWKSNPDDQKIAETFFKTAEGVRLLAVLKESTAPVASALPGMAGVHEDSKNLQRAAGAQQLLEYIPTLYRSAMQGQQGQREAADRLAAERRIHLAVASQQSPADS